MPHALSASQERLASKFQTAPITLVRIEQDSQTTFHSTDVVLFPWSGGADEHYPSLNRISIDKSFSFLPKPSTLQLPKGQFSLNNIAVDGTTLLEIFQNGDPIEGALVTVMTVLMPVEMRANRWASPVLADTRRTSGYVDLSSYSVSDAIVEARMAVTRFRATEDVLDFQMDKPSPGFYGSGWVSTAGWPRLVESTADFYQAEPFYRPFDLDSGVQTSADDWDDSPLPSSATGERLPFHYGVSDRVPISMEIQGAVHRTGERIDNTRDIISYSIDGLDVIPDTGFGLAGVEIFEWDGKTTGGLDLVGSRPRLNSDLQTHRAQQAFHILPHEIRGLITFEGRVLTLYGRNSKSDDWVSLSSTDWQSGQFELRMPSGWTDPPEWFVGYGGGGVNPNYYAFYTGVAFDRDAVSTLYRNLLGSGSEENANRAITYQVEFDGDVSQIQGVAIDSDGVRFNPNIQQLEQGRWDFGGTTPPSFSTDDVWITEDAVPQPSPVSRDSHDDLVLTFTGAETILLVPGPGTVAINTATGPVQVGKYLIEHVHIEMQLEKNLAYNEALYWGHDPTVFSLKPFLDYSLAWNATAMEAEVNPAGDNVRPILPKSLSSGTFQAENGDLWVLGSTVRIGKSPGEIVGDWTEVKPATLDVRFDPLFPPEVNLNFIPSFECRLFVRAVPRVFVAKEHTGINDYLISGRFNVPRTGYQPWKHLFFFVASLDSTIPVTQLQENETPTPVFQFAADIEGIRGSQMSYASGSSTLIKDLDVEADIASQVDLTSESESESGDTFVRVRGTAADLIDDSEARIDAVSQHDLTDRIVYLDVYNIWPTNVFVSRHNSGMKMRLEDTSGNVRTIRTNHGRLLTLPSWGDYDFTDPYETTGWRRVEFDVMNDIIDPSDPLFDVTDVQYFTIVWGGLAPAGQGIRDLRHSGATINYSTQQALRNPSDCIQHWLMTAGLEGGAVGNLDDTSFSGLAADQDTLGLAFDCDARDLGETWEKVAARMAFEGLCLLRSFEDTTQTKWKIIGPDDSGNWPAVEGTLEDIQGLRITGRALKNIGSAFVVQYGRQWDRNLFDTINFGAIISEDNAGVADIAGAENIRLLAIRDATAAQAWTDQWKTWHSGQLDLLSFYVNDREGIPLIEGETWNIPYTLAAGSPSRKVLILHVIKRDDKPITVEAVEVT